MYIYPTKSRRINAKTLCLYIQIARLALYEALGLSKEAIEERMKENLEEDGIVVGDETRLRQIITNLAR